MYRWQQPHLYSSTLISLSDFCKKDQSEQLTTGKPHAIVVSKFGADNLESLISDLVVVASGNDMHIALAGQLKNGGVDATNTTEAEEKDARLRHCTIDISVSLRVS